MIFDGPLPPEPHPIVPTYLDDPQVQEHLANLQELFRRAYPEAQFKAYETEEPVQGVLLTVYLPSEDSAIPDDVEDYLFHLLDRQGLFVYLSKHTLQEAVAQAA